MNHAAKSFSLQTTLALLALSTLLTSALIANERPEAAPTSVEITVDASQLGKDIPRGPAGLNLCWLLDSDIHHDQAISTEMALSQLGAGSLRFPYGHLADNYLWTSPPYDQAEQGLTPRVASKSETPGRWRWATVDDGTFYSAMDFDEYVAMCKRIDVAPLVVVNALSHKYEGGPTYDELKQAAVEWVRYAKRNDCEIAYWQIGNEVDHHSDIMPREEYVALYADFTAAMKGADPTAKVGPGILSQPLYYRDLLETRPELIDFGSVHVYTFGREWDWETWSASEDDFIRSIHRCQAEIDASSKPDLELLVTETSSYGGGQSTNRTNDLFKALWWFEILMNEIAAKNVSYTHFWCTHSPWGWDPDRENTPTLADALDNNNRPTPTGTVCQLVNDNLGERMIALHRVHGPIRSYASWSDERQTITLLLLNKSEESVDVEFDLKGISSPRLVQQGVFTGDGPSDLTPTYTVETVDVDLNAASIISLGPLSVTALIIQ
jgi:alpha-L-arabinofuranosidase